MAFSIGDVGMAEREVLNVRFEASIADLADAVDNGIWRSAPGFGPAQWVVFGRGVRTHAVNMPRVLGVPALTSLWDGDTWIALAVTNSGGTWGRGEHLAARLDLKPVGKRTDRIDARLVCEWEPFLPAADALAYELQLRFKQLRKGGPRKTPRKKRLAIVTGFRELEGDKFLEVYCEENGIHQSTFREWEKELIEEGYLPEADS